jgi:hypothetical protein
MNMFDKQVLRRVVLGDEPDGSVDNDDDEEQDFEWPLPSNNGRLSSMSVAPLRTRATRAGTMSSKASGRTGGTVSDREDDDD